MKSVDKVELICERCNKSFWLYPSLALPKGRHPRRFCSIECRRSGWGQSPDLTCKTCGVVFTIPRAWIKKDNGQGQYCSLKCKTHTTDHKKIVRARVFQARKNREKNAPGHATKEQVRWRIEMTGGMCYLCGDVATAIDHVIPLSRGGSNWPANMRPVCKRCNSKKRHRTYKEYLEYISPR